MSEGIFGRLELDLIWPGLVISVDLRTGAMESELFIHSHTKSSGNMCSQYRHNSPHSPSAWNVAVESPDVRGGVGHSLNPPPLHSGAQTQQTSSFSSSDVAPMIPNKQTNKQDASSPSPPLRQGQLARIHIEHEVSGSSVYFMSLGNIEDRQYSRSIVQISKVFQEES